jgi:hypothetical protein
MNRRWQSDGVPLWRKLFSSNWWWYGEVNPDLASLPPPEKRPKFWRPEVIFVFLLLWPMPTLLVIKDELQAGYWSFNPNTTYIGRIVETSYHYPQLRVEVLNKTVVPVGFPMNHPLGVPKTKYPVGEWTTMVDRLQRLQYDCPDRMLAFEAQPLKLTFYPILQVWQVRCASGAVLIPAQDIVRVWNDFNAGGRSMLFTFSGFVSVFFIVLVIRRERKLYVKS